MAAKKPVFALRELIDIICIILLLAFGFSYKFEGPATLSTWFGGFLLILILVAISIFVHELVHKFVAAKVGAVATPRFWFSGAVIFILLLIFTGGWIVFAAPWAITITPIRMYKPGMPRAHMDPREEGLIALSGPLANLGLAVVAKLLAPVLGLLAPKLIAINAAIAVFNLIPFFILLPALAFQWTKFKPVDIPHTEGDFVFFGSRTLWIFAFVFTLVTSIALFYLQPLASILIAFISAAAIWVAWNYYLEPETAPGFELRGPTPRAEGEGPSFRKYK